MRGGHVISRLRCAFSCSSIKLAPGRVSGLRELRSDSCAGDPPPSPERRTGRVRKWLEAEVALNLGSLLALKKPDSSEKVRTLPQTRGLFQKLVLLHDHALAAATVEDLRQVYSRLNLEERWELLNYLATEFGIDNADASVKAQHFLDVLLRPGARSEEAAAGALLQAEQELQRALTPCYVRVFEAINTQPGGLKLLADLRGDLLGALRAGASASLRRLDGVLRRLLSSWLTPACLTLTRITWDSPASLIAKIIAHEKVHPFESVQAVRTRLGRGRRLFAYFHQAMPGEPLIFLQLALLPHMAAQAKEVLEGALEEAHATAAVFYSIDATQGGLGGIDLGHFLIKRVVHLLQAEFPQVITFATLSPLPGFLKWLLPKLAAGGGQQEELLLDTEVAALLEALSPTHRRSGGDLKALAQGALHAALADPEAKWVHSCKQQEAMKAPLMRLAARYLYCEKKRGRCFDPVANFHIRNGARMERLNWLADTSSLRLQTSAGLMVNYLYRMNDIDNNSHLYADQREVACSEQILSLFIRLVAT